MLIASLILNALLALWIVHLTKKLTEAETQLKHERGSHQEKLDALKESFQAASIDALKSNSQSFLELATAKLEKYQTGASGDLKARQTAITEMVKPIKESLEKVDTKLIELERNRTSTHSSLTEQIKALSSTQNQLQAETHNLVKALRTPHVRGRWGEIQLQRVVEMAGMIEHCDFAQQESCETESGRLRPDMVIKLPNQKLIVVDSKTPLHAYLEALEVDSDELRDQKFKDHARHIRTHIQQLSTKAYWDQFPSSPEFVVLFLPGEPFFSAALQYDPTLIEVGVEQKVIIATPTTLIALLRSVAYGWQQEQVAENAQLLRDLGKTLYERVKSMTNHLQDTGKSLERTIQSYNKLVGSYDRRVRVTTQKFKELGATTAEDLPIPEGITQVPRLDVEQKT